MAYLHFVPLTECEQQIADETKLAKLIDAAEARGAAARQAEIVAWLRRASGHNRRTLYRAADQIEGGAK